MLFKLADRSKRGNGPIRVLYPGVSRGRQDTGLATLGRIDHATIPAGAVVPMHPHINDEILTYLRHGRVQHTDSGGNGGEINAQRLMLMKAGQRLSHEEHVLVEGGQLQGLQIFIRPESKDLAPQVNFYDLPEVNSVNVWRLLAGRGDSGAPLVLRSSTWIYDIRLTHDLGLPHLPQAGLTSLLYVFDGQAKVSDLELTKGDSLIIQDEPDVVVQSDGADLVLFVTDERSVYYSGGMFSGNQV
jgi:redox-sensitive bicupin YhaK (pirin superfamily)